MYLACIFWLFGENSYINLTTSLIARYIQDINLGAIETAFPREREKTVGKG